MTEIKIPVLDLGPARAEIQDDLAIRWRSLLTQTQFIGGREVQEFEEAFAAYCDAPACVGVANGTDALILALRALDLPAEGEVIVPAFTFAATAEAVLLAGGRPIFADIEPDTLNLDVADVAAKIGDATVGIIGVHLYGHPFEVDALVDLARQHELFLIEDAAQAHGAKWRGKRIGSLGDLAAFSFYPTKNLGAFGDAGALTGDASRVDRVRALANHGQTSRYRHEWLGTNSRLDALQASVLVCRLALLDRDNRRRRALADRYRRNLRGVEGLRLPGELPEAEPVYHQFTIQTEERDALQAFLTARGIGCAVHYPEPLHLQPAFRGEAEPEALPVATRAASQVLCLPMHAHLREAQVDEVSASIRDFLAQTG